MDSNLNNSSADKRDWLPIDRQTSRLNQAQPITDFATCFQREPTQALTTVSKPLDRFRHSLDPPRLYRIFIIGSERRHAPELRAVYAKVCPYGSVRGRSARGVPTATKADANEKAALPSPEARLRIEGSLTLSNPSRAHGRRRAWGIASSPEYPPPWLRWSASGRRWKRRSGAPCGAPWWGR